MRTVRIARLIATLSSIVACGPAPRGTPDGGASGDGSVDAGGTACERAAAERSYVGCDYWPTVTANVVADVFDFAVIVANAGDATARVRVTGPNGVDQQHEVQPNQLVKIYLPWVHELKGPSATSMWDVFGLQRAVLAKGGAYHLTSDQPVSVYQFNALEYEGRGGPPGKSWAGCPDFAEDGTCFSFTNDASLLLPTTALTGSYRLPSYPATTYQGPGFKPPGPWFAITATENGTTVLFKTSSTASTIGGGPMTELGSSQTAMVTLDAGDVLEVPSGRDGQNDLSGSVVAADKPVQLISGHACAEVPRGVAACDHLEESVFPAETHGKQYAIPTPTAPNGGSFGHLVRIYGNVDGTTLTYEPAVPGAPTVVNSGQVLDLGISTTSFVVTADQPIAVGTFLVGGEFGVGPTPAGAERGDPSMSTMIAVEQYRTKAVFLAPDDYDVSFIDVVMKPGTQLVLDGQTVTGAAVAIGASGWSHQRIRLGPGQGGAHVLTSDQPVGVQVVGYGRFTSYHYPAGLDLQKIAPPIL